MFRTLISKARAAETSLIKKRCYASAQGYKQEVDEPASRVSGNPGTMWLGAIVATIVLYVGFMRYNDRNTNKDLRARPLETPSDVPNTTPVPGKKPEDVDR